MLKYLHYSSGFQLLQLYVKSTFHSPLLSVTAAVWPYIPENLRYPPQIELLFVCVSIQGEHLFRQELQVGWSGLLLLTKHPLLLPASWKLWPFVNPRAFPSPYFSQEVFSVDRNPLFQLLLYNVLRMYVDSWIGICLSIRLHRNASCEINQFTWFTWYRGWAINTYRVTITTSRYVRIWPNSIEIFIMEPNLFQSVSMDSFAIYYFKAVKCPNIPKKT